MSPPRTDRTVTASTRALATISPEPTGRLYLCLWMAWLETPRDDFRAASREWTKDAGKHEVSKYASKIKHVQRHFKPSEIRCGSYLGFVSANCDDADEKTSPLSSSSWVPCPLNLLQVFLQNHPSKLNSIYPKSFMSHPQNIKTLKIMSPKIFGPQKILCLQKILGPEKY